MQHGRAFDLPSVRDTKIGSVAWCRDDLAWAAAWLYRETGDNAYLSDAYFFYSQHQTQEGDYDKRYLVRFCSTAPLVAVMPAQAVERPASSAFVVCLAQFMSCSGDLCPARCM